ncbi:MAG: LysM peptidoglycan-binding domain-containing protein [Flavobacteriales bacterium]|nr:LysM peptidoglycan-binding domain-containing protein [Flavobacteriales bacterium]
MRLTVVCLVLVLNWPFALCAQDVQNLDFLEKCTDSSVNQWLSTAFKKRFPSYFDYDQCPPAFQHAQTDGSSQGLDLELARPLLYSDHLLDLWLNADCDKFIHIRALADLYFPLFDKKLNALGMHRDYKYLAVVLSGLDASYVKGSRSGLWHLEYVVARKYKLQITDQIDERNAADISTDAALTHLLFLEKMYPQEPAKVILAFMGSVSLVEDYVASAKSEGKSFVDVLSAKDRARLEAFYTTSRLFESLETKNALFDYIAMLNEYENQVFTSTVSFKAMEQLLPSTSGELHGLNPVYVGNEIPGMYRDVPFIVNTASAKWITAHGDSLYNWTEKQHEADLARRNKDVQRMEHGVPAPGTYDEIHYTVRQGDVLGVIAEKFGVGVSEIRSWNGLKGDMIYAGQDLVIYGKKATDKEPVVEQRTENKPPERKPSAPKSEEYSEYTVKSGDSLWLIARKFPGVSAENIMDWNNCDENIRPGQILKIYK